MRFATASNAIAARLISGGSGNELYHGWKTQQVLDVMVEASIEKDIENILIFLRSMLLYFLFFLFLRVRLIKTSLCTAVNYLFS